uniref:Uncharacterized protein n=1 Tax=Globodera rostochiensis TaxID=31243 RepID=A0A914HEV2_GLORO
MRPPPPFFAKTSSIRVHLSIIPYLFFRFIRSNFSSSSDRILLLFRSNSSSSIIVFLYLFPAPLPSPLLFHKLPCPSIHPPLLVGDS